MSSPGGTPPKRRPGGFSLIEVIVATAIFSVLTGLLATFVIQMVRTNAGTRARLSTTEQLRVGMDTMTKGLRTAVRPEQVNTSCVSTASWNCASPFLEATAQSVSLYANYGDTAGPRVTTYRVELDPRRVGTGRLVEEQQAPAVPTGSPVLACGTGCVSRILVDNITISPASQVFAFRDATGAALTTSATDLARAARIVVSLPVNGARDYAASSASSTVFLPNSVMGR
jgi:prepilin-type N-terminal cleavage/methylation domain-containing protein